MAFDLNALGGGEISRTIEKHLRAAYDQGRADATAAILQAAGAPIPASAPQPVMRERVREASTTAKKAPRGLVPEVLSVVMDEYPGETIMDYERRAVEFDNRIAAKSVGNELRRNDGVRYRRDRNRWYLIGHRNSVATAPDNEEAADSPVGVKSAAPLFNQSHGGLNGAALA